jgi:DNA (cytosine-5)-methyltransferase 1
MPKNVSLFTGCGGLDLGLEAAGFDVAVAVEFDGTACKTLRRNRSWPVIERDIHNVPSMELQSTGEFALGEADLLVGGPPCQPFSKSAYWVKGDTDRLDDPRADTLTAFLRVLRDLRPRVFLLENVLGLAYRGKDEGIRLLQRSVDSINRVLKTNYSFEWQVMNSADYGVPQIRERLFIVGARDGSRFRFPEPTHAKPEDAGSRLFSLAREPWHTAWDAIGDLNDCKHTELRAGGRWGDLLQSIPEGKNYLHHTSRGEGLPLFGWRRRYWSFLLKLGKNLPSWTIQAQPGSAIGPFHWTNRRLSVPELCRLQTIPDGYEIEGGRSETQRQVGNAVPSLMGEILGRAISEQLLGLPVRKGAPTLLPQRRSPTPPPEPVRDVPQKYLHLKGNHASHPGTGRGHLVRGQTG